MDPVVVSDVYWNSLGTKIISIIIGQAFAALTFWIMLSYFSKQMQNFWNDNASNFIATLVSNSSKSDGNTNTNTQSGKVVVEYQNIDRYVDDGNYRLLKFSNRFYFLTSMLIGIQK